MNDVKNIQMCKMADVCIEFANNKGIHLRNDSSLLDFGCGNADLASALYDRGCSNVLGFDIREGKQKDNRIQKINNVPVLLSHYEMNRMSIDGEYKIEFPDNKFEMVISNQVFEHVMNYDATAREISRITKKGGIHLHFFPSKYALIERHIMLPLGGFFHPAYYVNAWCRTGFYKNYSMRMKRVQLLNLDVKEQSKWWLSFFENQVNYLSANEIKKIFNKYFSLVKFADKEFLSVWPGGLQKISKLMSYMPVIEKLHSIFRMRILYLKK